ncbi:unnamed protein product [Coregonus sp. 'balchen']|nr:unnamed protein product [Coregonus sp. 'balchen']
MNPKPSSWRKKMLPDSFFKEPDSGSHSRQSSTDSGSHPPRLTVQHVRSHSSPATLQLGLGANPTPSPVHHSHIRHQSFDVAEELPHGWEMAYTSNGQKYFLKSLSPLTDSLHRHPLTDTFNPSVPVQLFKVPLPNPASPSWTEEELPSWLDIATHRNRLWHAWTDPQKQTLACVDRPTETDSGMRGQTHRNRLWHAWTDPQKQTLACVDRPTETDSGMRGQTHRNRLWHAWTDPQKQTLACVDRPTETDSGMRGQTHRNRLWHAWTDPQKQTLACVDRPTETDSEPLLGLDQPAH